MGHGLVAVPDPRSRRRSTSAATSTRSTRAASTASCRSSTRTRSGAARPSWSRRACASPTTTSAGLVVRMTKVLEVRNLVKEFPGVKALAGRRPRRARGGGALPARPERRRQVDAHQVRLGRARADERRDPLPGRAAAAGRPGRVAQARRRDDLPGARPRPRPERRREHLPRARAAPRAAPRPRQDVPRVRGAARRGSGTSRSRVRAKVGAAAARRRSRSSRSRARSRATCGC